ncbi:p20 subunit of caspase [Ceratocystis lukuohia]|uniref:P20 subunit of caspase n=1 Tax=Ceratocystis lukuohia TaxID=2019550 RepID=A0ABR4MNX3_9PEZI
MSGYNYPHYDGTTPLPNGVSPQYISSPGYYDQQQQYQQQVPAAAYQTYPQNPEAGFNYAATPGQQVYQQYPQFSSPGSTAYSPQQNNLIASFQTATPMTYAPNTMAGPSSGVVDPGVYATAGGADATAPPPSYDFKLPPCQGRKKALLIGINYFGQRGQLRGCVNDVKNMSAYLTQQFGYKREDMVILTDDQHNPIGHPTKHNILRAMHWLTKDAKSGDSLFFHYSGHGGQTRDPESEDPEGYDEVIYPVDFRQTGHISDDEMHRILVKPLCQGVRLTAIFDSCHSGTALDLPYIYSTQGIMKEPNGVQAAGTELLQSVSAYTQGQGEAETVKRGFIGLLKRATAGDESLQRSKLMKSSEADVVMFSGSKDNQTSADSMVSSQPTGAMSWAFITALRKNPQQSYVQLLNSIRDELATKYTQRPQLSCSHPLSKHHPLMIKQYKAPSSRTSP